jgi:sulfonate transport system permease protein
VVAALRSIRVRRGLVGLLALLALYGLAAQIASGRLPTRVSLPMHDIEGVELLPTYSSLVEEGVFLVQAGILLKGAAVSAGRVLAGLVLGSVVGIALGLAMGWAARVEYALDPWVVLLRFTPALALLPLYVLWFGLGEAAKIGLIATGVAVVTLQGAYQGVRGIPGVYWDAAAALAAPRSLVLRRIVFPAALPQILASLRIAIALGWVTVIAAELIKPSMPSLGYLLALAGAYPRVPTIVIALAAIALLVLVSDGLTLAAYRWATRWMRRRYA